MTTVRAYTNDQPSHDQSPKGAVSRAAEAHSMIPTSTGAAKAVGLVLPELAGKRNGVAIRAPTPNVISNSWPSARPRRKRSTAP
jgi:glyceraldehyde 3-phosphate dehydrogenase